MKKEKIKGFAYIDFYDAKGGLIKSIRQNMGELADLSAISVPEGYSFKLYTDKQFTQKYSSDTPISENLSLYVKIIEPSASKTVVSDDGKTFNISSVSITNGNEVILALYKENRLVDMKTWIYDGGNLSYTTDENYDFVKVMTWKTFGDIIPVGSAEDV